MTARILHGTRINESGAGAIIYDGCTGQVYDAMFRDCDEAQAFLDWLSPSDPKDLDHGEFRALIRQFRTRCREDVTT